MGFEKFSVVLYPLENSPLCCSNDAFSLQHLAEELLTAWPTLHPDTVETERCYPPKSQNVEIFVSDTMDGLFQVFISLGSTKRDELTISLDFAYTNPRSIYEPFCSFVDWAMRRFNLYCHVVPCLAPTQNEGADDITEPLNLRPVLIPCIEYNRHLWQLDAQTTEEAILRPGDAIARFIVPRLVVSS